MLDETITGSDLKKSDLTIMVVDRQLFDGT